MFHRSDDAFPVGSGQFRHGDGRHHHGWPGVRAGAESVHRNKPEWARADPESRPEPKEALGLSEGFPTWAPHGPFPKGIWPLTA